VERRVVVSTEAGLHARPAGQFVQTAARFHAQVRIANASAGRGPASARSILAILALGVRQGHEVLISAEGDDAEAAVDALCALLVADAPGDLAPS
jgi:phosphotransferase system HPr (HPr) family protein